MISTKKASKILLAPDEAKRNRLIDDLMEADAKQLLKYCFEVMLEQNHAKSTEN